MKTCWFRDIIGIKPDQEECKRLHPDGCEGCPFFLPDPPEPDGDGEFDELPDFD